MSTTEKKSRVRAVLDPVTDRLERLEQRAHDNAREIAELKRRARALGLKGVRYGLIVALAVASPKDAIRQLLGYIDAAEGDDPPDDTDEV